MFRHDFKISVVPCRGKIGPLLLLCQVGLSGCVTTAGQDMASSGYQPTLVEERLADSGNRVAAALEQLARLKGAVSPVPPAPVNVQAAPIDLQKPISKAWQGTAGVAVKWLGDLIGYRVRIFGDEPPALALVRIDADRVPVIRVIESVGNQLGNRATIRLDPAARLIDLTYSIPPNAPGSRS